MRTRGARELATAALALLASCTTSGTGLDGASSFRVTVTKVNGKTPPTAAAPQPANRGNVDDAWDFDIVARLPTGELDASFNGEVRISVEPGTVVRIDGEGGVGRNLRIVNGKAAATVVVTAVYGPARLWAEDLGYAPAEAGKTAKCSNGKNDDSDEDVLIDFPTDPGCAFANDDTEEGGTYAAGVSGPVHYALPRIVDIQGEGSETPYPFEGIEVNATSPQRLVVTRVSSDGFYVSDVADTDQGYNHLYAFNFNTPSFMRVCDRVSYLAGTVNEFFGYTELSFPSYQVIPLIEGNEANCEVPEPAFLKRPTIVDPVAMEKLEAGLVRVLRARVAKNFGSGAAKDNAFAPGNSNCDLNGDGQVDFSNGPETSCANACSDANDCAEWTSYSARGNYKIVTGTCAETKPCTNPALCKGGGCAADPGTGAEVCFTACLDGAGHEDDCKDACDPPGACMGACSLAAIQLNTGTVVGFDPVANKGKELDAVTGTLRNFSGGSLNWTIETRCPDDLACPSKGCIPTVKGPKEACVRAHSAEDTEGNN